MPGFDAGFDMSGITNFQIPKLDFPTSSGSSGTSFGSGLLGAGLNIGASIYNNLEARKSADVAYRRQKELLEKQMSFASSEAEKQRYASSLISIVNQMRALGMNTDLLYGGQPSQGSMSSAGTPGIGHVQPAGVFPMARVTDAVEQMANARRAELVESEIEANKAVAFKNNSEGERNATLLPYDVQIRQSEAEVNNSIVALNVSEVGLNEQQCELIRKTIEKVGAEINLTNQRINESLSAEELNYARAELTDKQRERYDELIDATIAEMNARVKQMIAEAGYLNAQSRLTDAELRQMNEYILAEYGIDVNGEGNREEGAAAMRKIGLIMQNGNLAVEFDFKNRTVDERVDAANLEDNKVRSEIVRNYARSFQLICNGTRDLVNIIADFIPAGKAVKAGKAVRKAPSDGKPGVSMPNGNRRMSEWPGGRPPNHY